MSEMEKIEPSDLAEAAEGLQRLIDAAAKGELDAPNSVLLRLDAAVRTLQALSEAAPSRPEPTDA